MDTDPCEIAEFQAVDVLQTDPPDAFGYGEPKLWCLDDYSDFYTHLANDEGEEDENLPLAAQYFDQKCTSAMAFGMMETAC